MRWRFNRGARAKVLDAVQHYAEAGGPAVRFVDAVEATVARILEEPSRFRPLEAGIRTTRVPDCPYSIVFTVEETTAIILAVKHDRRDPDYWRHRLKR
jgi:plasmid stabilization system protein ParE